MMKIFMMSVLSAPRICCLRKKQKLRVYRFACLLGVYTQQKDKKCYLLVCFLLFASIEPTQYQPAPTGTNRTLPVMSCRTAAFFLPAEA